jgi:hypothetical protein
VNRLRRICGELRVTRPVYYFVDREKVVARLEPQGQILVDDETLADTDDPTRNSPLYWLPARLPEVPVDDDWQ